LLSLPFLLAKKQKMLFRSTLLLLLAPATLTLGYYDGTMRTACWRGPEFTEVILNCGFAQIAFENLPPPGQHLYYTGEEFSINATLSLLGSEIVPSEGGFLIPHANVHMCKTEGGLYGSEWVLFC
jgi:hypothetical protein